MLHFVVCIWPSRISSTDPLNHFSAKKRHLLTELLICCSVSYSKHGRKAAVWHECVCVGACVSVQKESGLKTPLPASMNISCFNFQFKICLFLYPLIAPALKPLQPFLYTLNLINILKSVNIWFIISSPNFAHLRVDFTSQTWRIWKSWHFSKK